MKRIAFIVGLFALSLSWTTGVRGQDKVQYFDRKIGKDADFVVWSKSPLDAGTVCLQTWIDGKKYFDRGLAEQHAASLAKEREELLGKAKKLAKLSGGGHGGSGDSGDSFFRVSLEHEFDGRDRGCLDEE